MSEGPQPEAPESQLESERWEDFGRLPRRRRHRLIGLAILRASTTTTILLIAYAQLPFTRLSQTRSLVAVLLGLAVVIIVLVAQFWQTMRSPYPRLRAVEGLMTSGPLFALVFATTHYLIGRIDPSGYSQPMTRLDALYFTVTTFATVGYGDISPVSQPARLMALIQMVCGLLLVGVIAKLLLGVASDTERQRITAGPGDRPRAPRRRASATRSH